MITSFSEVSQQKINLFQGLNKLSFSPLDTLNENRTCFGAFESDMFGVKMEETYPKLIEESSTQIRATDTQAKLVLGQDN